VLLVATKLTEELTVLPFAGLVTVTPAKAVEAAKANPQIARARTCFFILASLRSETKLENTKPFTTKESHRTFRRDNLNRSTPLTPIWAASESGSRRKPERSAPTVYRIYPSVKKKRPEDPKDANR
jgi:hypothetical protein